MPVKKIAIAKNSNSPRFRFTLSSLLAVASISPVQGYKAAKLQVIDKFYRIKVGHEKLYPTLLITALINQYRSGQNNNAHSTWLQ
jgi:hypothetical protein